jgi:hypothetical protein
LPQNGVSATSRNGVTPAANVNCPGVGIRVFGRLDLPSDQTAATQKREEGPGIFAAAHIDRSVL